MTIYKICSRDVWQRALEAGRFLGAAVDVQDGFIHFSAAHQVRETAAKHFSGQSDLVLVAVEAELLGDALKWEKSRGGDLFPHLYGSLDVQHVSSVVSLPIDTSGCFQFPVTSCSA